MGTNGAFGGSGSATWEQVRYEWVSLGTSGDADGTGDHSGEDDNSAEGSDSSDSAGFDPLIEAIANALKHARATRISISVGMTDQVLRAVVRDDGVGGASEGFGLTSLRDRVASVGGEFTVDSPPGAGTSITVEIPCAS